MNFDELQEQIPGNLKDADFKNAQGSLMANMATETIKSTHPIILLSSLVALICVLVILIGGSVVLFINYVFFQIILSIFAISILTIYIKIKHNGKQRRKKQAKARK